MHIVGNQGAHQQCDNGGSGATTAAGELACREAELLRIVDLMAADVAERLRERGITLTLTDAARHALVTEGYDPTYGAQPLRRVLQRQVENPVSRRLRSGVQWNRWRRR